MLKNSGSFVFLGTGASTGVPIISCHCLVCTSLDPKNKRFRSSGLLKICEKQILIDPGPDFRTQALLNGIDHLDGVMITHAHYDHMAGFDDLKVYAFQKKPLPCLVSDSTYGELKHRSSYLIGPSPYLKGELYFDFTVVTAIEHESYFCDLPCQIVHYEQNHTLVTGYRIGNFAYVTDVKTYDEPLIQSLQGIDILVLSGLQKEATFSHLSLDEAIQLSRQVGPKMTWLSHISHHLDHEKTNQVLPADIQLAYDGLEITILC